MKNNIMIIIKFFYINNIIEIGFKNNNLILNKFNEFIFIILLLN